MNPGRIIACCLVALPAIARGADEWLDRVDDALTTAAWNDTVRLRLSGAVDLEEYEFDRPAPGLISTDAARLFNPRLTLYLDAQVGTPSIFSSSRGRSGRSIPPTTARKCGWRNMRCGSRPGPAGASASSSANSRR